MNGWTPTERVKPATKEQLIALRDLLLSHNDKHAAAAVDNVIDILSRAANPIVNTSAKVKVLSNPHINGSIRQVSEPVSNKWDFTPIPEDMPIIDITKIDPIEF